MYVCLVGVRAVRLLFVLVVFLVGLLLFWLVSIRGVGGLLCFSRYLFLCGAVRFFLFSFYLL